MVRSDFLDFECLAYATRRSGRAVTSFFNAQLAPLDLTVAQFGLMAAVGKMPGSTLKAIGDAMLIDDSTLARNFTVLVRRGLIEAGGGRGRGGKRISLTPAGRNLQREASVIWAETNRRLARELGAKQAAQGIAFLRALGQASQRLNDKDEAAADPGARRAHKTIA